jgi:AcrR family transcriptional regulator
MSEKNLHPAQLRLVSKVIPIRSREITCQRLVGAVGRVLAREGFRGIGVNAVAREAGVDKKLIYRYFQGLPKLVAEYGGTLEFWPSASELMGEDRCVLMHLSPGRLLAEFFRRYVRAIRARPQTLEIMAWEAVEKNELTCLLEGARVKTALEFFELMGEDPPEDVDLTALVLLMAGAAHFLATRSRNHRILGGLDLQSEEDWERLEKTMAIMLERTLDAAGPKKGEAAPPPR